jgi:hypothetical protein
MGERPAPVPGVDPLFTDDDVTEILDFIADEHLIHEPCGQPRVESFNPANEWVYAATAVACHACAAMARAGKALDVTDGVYVIVEKNG